LLGVGEPRRNPKELAPAEAGGQDTANMVLVPFAETKGTRRWGAKPLHNKDEDGFLSKANRNEADRKDICQKLAGMTEKWL